MNKSFFPLFLLFFIYACEPNHQVISLNKDGSGYLESSFDISKPVDLFLQSAKDNADQDSTKTLAYNLVSELYKAESKDTVINVYHQLPDSLKVGRDRFNLLKNVTIKVGSNFKEQSSGFSLKVEFESEKKLLQTFSQFDSLKVDVTKAAMEKKKFDGSEDFFPKYSIDMKSQIIRIPHSDLAKKMARDSMVTKMFERAATKNGEKKQVPIFLEMLFVGSVTTIVYAPGDIIFSNDPNAVIDGNKIVFEASKIEILQTKDTLDRILKFKK